MSNKNKWSSNLGFILAAAGSSVGLGNLWKFPYLMGNNGGFQFLIVYLLFVIILGMPIMITETSIGRMSSSGPIKTYEKLNKKSKIIGIVGVVCAFIILSYYSVIGGWVLKYIQSYATTMNAPSSFKEYTASSTEPVIWHLVFIVCVLLICLKGASGIEKASKFMMPALFILLLIIVVRSVTLPNSEAGLKFVFTPESGFSFASISAALGQVFYSLSLCMGITITYGSYLGKDENIPKNTAIIAGLDSLVAVLAGLAIFPAVFSFGLNPAEGAGLTFGTLPNVFGAMKGGFIFAILFFALMFFAALTSAIALLECVVSAVLDSFHCSRTVATIILAAGAFVLGIPSALSSGVLGNVKILGYSVFDFMCMITDNILMPIGGVMMCIFIGWIWNPTKIIEHIEESGKPFKLKKPWLICIKYAAPILVIAVTIAGFIGIYQVVSSM